MLHELIASDTGKARLACLVGGVNRIRDWTNSFERFCRRILKLFCSVSNSAHTTDTDRTRQDSLVLSVLVMAATTGWSGEGVRTPQLGRTPKFLRSFFDE